MNEINFQIQPEQIPVDCLTPISLGIENLHTRPLQNLVFRLKTESGLQVLGSQKVKITHLEPGQTIWHAVKCLGKTTGPQSLSLVRISARSAGKGIKLADVHLVLHITPDTQQESQPLQFATQRATLTQNQWGLLAVTVQNRTTEPLEITSIRPATPEVRFEPSPQLPFPPGQTQCVNLNVNCPTAGEYSLRLIADVQTGTQPTIQQTLEVPVYVQPAAGTHIQNTHIETGDIVQVGSSGTIIGNSSASGRQSQSTAGSTADKPPTCPACGGELEPDSLFCSHCGHQLSA